MNTIEQDLEMAEFWAQGVNHLETDGWRATCKRLADEVRRLQNCQEVKHVEPVNVELLATLRLARDMFIANGVDLPRTMTCIRKAIAAAESASTQPVNQQLLAIVKKYGHIIGCHKNAFAGICTCGMDAAIAAAESAQAQEGGAA